jgi:hypothetical protein
VNARKILKRLGWALAAATASFCIVGIVAFFALDQWIRMTVPPEELSAANGVLVIGGTFIAASVAAFLGFLIVVTRPEP